MLTGRLHSIETLGSLDGPGLRTVFFMQGCNMRCLYCHNRDSWEVAGGKVCSSGELVEAALSYREYYGEKGGVTFSGGEPLLQADFLIEAVRELKRLGIHTALDTSGSVYSEKSRELFRLADLVMLDIKHSDKARYPELCGFPGGNAFSNLRYLQLQGLKYWIRQVIVEGYTDSEEQADGLARLLAARNPPEKTELLPYHDMGLSKWTASGSRYPLGGIKPPPAERMELLRNRLRGLST